MEEAVGLTELQLAILQVLWDRGEASTQDVQEALQDERGLAVTTVATLLSRLEKKGVLTHRREGRQYVYRALVTQAEVRRSKVRALTENLFGGDPAALMTHLVRADEVDADELARIRALIDEAEAAGGDG
ncbi:MAG: BlaI/MecI/CopY family transcriptional regulator [Longimicrobiales bacterium]|mgnify:CR=1 FL=1